mmetsp:Transcript_75620/g.163635  ORF Transcript_75620/g.163635 Transcript_75620/m.163635 type:complete len:223 (-) Transcript_75620:3-671(-)
MKRREQPPPRRQRKSQPLQLLLLRHAQRLQRRAETPGIVGEQRGVAAEVVLQEEGLNLLGVPLHLAREPQEPGHLDAGRATPLELPGASYRRSARAVAGQLLVLSAGRRPQGGARPDPRCDRSPGLALRRLEPALPGTGVAAFGAVGLGLDLAAKLPHLPLKPLAFEVAESRAPRVDSREARHRSLGVPCPRGQAARPEGQVVPGMRSPAEGPPPWKAPSVA